MTQTEQPELWHGAIGDSNPILTVREIGVMQVMNLLTNPIGAPRYMTTTSAKSGRRRPDWPSWTLSILHSSH